MNVNKWIAVVVGLGLVYLLSPILTPFILGALLAYLGDPMVSLLARYKVPRFIGVICVFLLVLLVIAAAIFFLLPLIQRQLMVLMEKVPAFIDWLQGTEIAARMNSAEIKKVIAQHMGKVKDLAPAVINVLSDSTLTIIAFISNLLLVPVVAFYLMRDWPKLMRNIVNLIPKNRRAVVVSLAQSCNEVVGAFLKGQLSVMLALGTIYSVGLWIVGLNIAVLVGVMSGLLAIVPYLGATVGIVTASIAMYLQTHEWLPVVYVWIVYAVGQSLEGMVLTPLLVGERIGLHPVAVIFSVLAGGVLFGFFGVLVALPVASVIWVLLRYAAQPAS